MNSKGSQAAGGQNTKAYSAKQESLKANLGIAAKTSFVLLLIRHFPVTFAVGSPYIALIIPQALFFQNPATFFILKVMIMALSATFATEFLLFRFKRKSRKILNGWTRSVRFKKKSRNLITVTWIAVVVGVVSALYGAAQGVGSVQVQIGAEEVSGLASTIASLFAGWLTVSIGLAFASFQAGQCSKGQLRLILLCLCLTKAIIAYLTGITAPFMSFVIALATTCLLMGLLRMWQAVAIATLLLTLWPVIFKLRNEYRHDTGVRIGETNAFDRLRFDEQVGSAAGFEVPIKIDTPGLFEIMRYGLLPRILDPNREQLSTGVQLNIYMGGSETSAYNFLPVTTTYVLKGPIYLVLWYSFWAFFVWKLWGAGSCNSPARLVILAIVVSGPLGWFATFPDATIGSVQTFVSSLPLLGLLWLNNESRGEGDRSDWQTRAVDLTA